MHPGDSEPGGQHIEWRVYHCSGRWQGYATAFGSPKIPKLVSGLCYWQRRQVRDHMIRAQDNGQVGIPTQYRKIL